MNEHKEFQVVPSLSLVLESLWANVNVSVGEDGIATVNMVGAEKLLKEIDVSQPTSGKIQIKGKGSKGGNDITVISGGGRQSVSMTSVRGGNIVITGGGSFVSVGGRGGSTVIIDGKVVSGGGNAEAIEGEIPQIQIKVPRGTSLDVSDVESVEAVGLAGKLNAYLGGQDNLKVTDVNGLKVKCGGQSRCNILNASGDTKLNTAGQSSIDIQGELGDVEADASGQSHITISGNCHDFEGDASGQSRISVTGRASGRVRQRESGQSRISVR